MSFTKEESIRLFRAHWAWLAKTGSVDKAAFLKKKGHVGILNDCYLCEYCKETVCNNCPIDWPDSTTGMSATCTDSYFDEWALCGDKTERKRLAKLISELPEKGVVG